MCLFWKRHNAEWEVEMPTCCKGLFLLPSYRREMCTFCPSNCYGSYKTGEVVFVAVVWLFFFSTGRERMQRAPGLVKGIWVIEVMHLPLGNIHRGCKYHSSFYSSVGNLWASYLKHWPTK